MDGDVDKGEGEEDDHAGDSQDRMRLDTAVIAIDEPAKKPNNHAAPDGGWGAASLPRRASARHFQPAANLAWLGSLATISA